MDVGVSVGMVLTPATVRPFVSRPLNASMSEDQYGNITAYGPSHVQTAFFIEMAYTVVPAVGFAVFFFTGNPSRSRIVIHPTTNEPISSFPPALFGALALMFLAAASGFGSVDTTMSLAASFAVHSQLHLPKQVGVDINFYIVIGMLIARVNGVWISFVLTPYKSACLFSGLGAAISGSAYALMTFYPEKGELWLWLFAVSSMMSVACLTTSTASWTLRHLPPHGYFLSLYQVGRCVGILAFPPLVTALSRYQFIEFLYAYSCVCFAGVTVALSGAHLLVRVYGDDYVLGYKPNPEYKRLIQN